MTQDQNSTSFGFFDPLTPYENKKGNLPHWRQSGVTFAVTFRLADSIPQDKLILWEAERRRWNDTHPEPWSEDDEKLFQQLFPDRLNEWLDQGYGSCVLRDPAIKRFMEGVLRYHHGQRYLLDEHVVMPNHVHAIVMPMEGRELSDILHSWKSFSAHRINKMRGSSGQVWQKESYDHIVRGEWDLERVRKYIRDNPHTSHPS